MSTSELTQELRELILRSAPDSSKAAPVKDCPADKPLDAFIPFSSLIVLGLIIAVEDRFRITVTRKAFRKACAAGATLASLVSLIQELQTSHEN